MEIIDDNTNGKMYANSISIHAKYLTLSLILIAISIIGDQLLQIKTTIFSNSYMRAFSDNSIHAIIASISWLMVCISRGASTQDYLVVLQTFLCAITASFVDFDHIIEARSLDIKVITQLTHRPFLHCTTLTVSVSLVIIITGLLIHNWMCHIYGWIVLTATFTHHLRDALRRGFWLYPFHTKPIPFWTYSFILMSYPLLCGWVMDIVAQQFLQRHMITGVKYKAIETEEI